MKPNQAAAHAPPEATQGRPDARARRSARRRQWIVGLAAASIALTAGAIPAVAAATSTPVVYYACVTNTTGAIKVVSATATCSTSQHKISWDSQGPPGPPGPPGVTTGYASLNSNAVLLGAGFANSVVGDSLSLPAGTFLVNVTADAWAWQTTDHVSCGLWDGNNGFPLDQSNATLFPDPSHYTDATIAITATTSVGGQMRVLCWDNTGQAGVGPVSITAIPVSTLQASGPAARSTRSGHHAPLLPRMPRGISPAIHH